MQLGLLKGSEANLIKNSTWLNSTKSYKQKKKSLILLCTMHKGSALFFL